MAREKIALLDELPARRRQALLMTAAGFSYKELEQHAGMSFTSVYRYLRESRVALRVLDRERSSIATHDDGALDLREPQHTHTR